MEKTLVLIPCVKSKLQTEAPAKDLYISAYFTKCRRYAESVPNSEWCILSALFGLVKPDQILPPYNYCLDKRDPKSCRHWAVKVRDAIAKNYAPPRNVIVIAGELYRDNLVPQLEAIGYSVKVPALGLGIGKQMQWLDQQASSKTTPKEKVNDDVA